MTARTFALPPNILWILADDLDNDFKQDRLAIMPNLKKLRESGVHFLNHVAANQCVDPLARLFCRAVFPTM